LKRDLLERIDEALAEARADRDAALKRRVDELIESCCPATTGFQDPEHDLAFMFEHKVMIKPMYSRHDLHPCGDGCSRGTDYLQSRDLHFNEYFEAPWMGGLVQGLPNYVDVFLDWPDGVGPSENYFMEWDDDEDDEFRGQGDMFARQRALYAAATELETDE
jgi:hypothetical protein